MSKLRKKFITVFAVLFCAMLALSTALFIPKTKTADAYASAHSSADVGELYNGADAQNAFNATNLQTLYNSILGGTNKTYDDVKNAATVAGTPLAGNDKIVEFGGLKWTIVYLSKAQKDLGGITSDPTKDGYAEDGDVVLTLWLADETLKGKWASWTNYDKDSGNLSSTYANIYGTSYMRSQVLNNGGSYYNYTTASSGNKNTTATSVTGSQDEYNSFAKFTMSHYYDNGVRKESTIKDYLVSPRYLSWQYQQSAAAQGFIPYATNTGYDLYNDAWGVMTGNFRISYSQNTAGYNEWKDDLVWLPSLTEVGWGKNVSVSGYESSENGGLWETTYEQRQYDPYGTVYPNNKQAEYNPLYVTWLRSAADSNTISAFRLYVEGGNYNRNVCDENLIRPAIHLNLTEASKVAYNEYSTSNNEKVYDGDPLEYKIPDFDKLDQVGTPTSGSTYQNGVFKATNPNTNADKTYELVLKPKSGYFWADWASRTDVSSENDKKYGQRTYIIKIKLAEIGVTWDYNISRMYGESLLQDDDGITIQGGQKYDVVYHLEHDDNDYPPDNPEPSEFNDNDGLTAVSGYYRVWYKITADFHNPKVGSYTVSLASDTVTISVTGTFSDVTYGDNTAAEINSSLKTRFTSLVNSSNVTMTGTSGAYSTSQILALLNNLNVVPCTKNGSKLVQATATNGYYAAGTYYIDLKYASGTGDIQFVWQSDVKFTIKKRDVHVNIVAEDGGELTHEYGNDPVSLVYELNAEYTNELIEVDKGSMASALRLSYIFTIDDTDKELEKDTPAKNYYNIVSSAGEGNYNVIFEPCKYIITKRPITLKVTDKEVPYGTDLTTDTFEFEKVSGTFVGSDGVGVITSKTFIIKSKVSEDIIYNLDDILLVDEYVLEGTAEADNYVFTVNSGTLTVTTADFDMSGVKLENKGYIYDGQPHEAQLSGELPSKDIKYSFRYVNYDTGEELDGPPVEVGLYIVYASFSHNNSNYNPITAVKAAYIRIAYTQEQLNEAYPPLPSDEQLAAAADLAKKKAEAKKSLDEEAKAKKDEIDADPNLTDNEKTAAKSEIDSELAAGNAAIDSAKDKDGVNKAYDDGKKEIDDTAELAKKKGSAKKSLEEVANNKKAEIDSNEELTDEEKDEAKAKVDAELAAGKNAIDSATDTSGVESAQSTSKTNIENIKGIHKENSSFPWWIIAVVVGLLLAAAAVIIIVVKKRQAADGDDEYDDFYDDEYDFDEEIEEDDDFGGDDF